MLVCAVRKGERRTGGGTGAMVEGSPGKYWNECVNRKDRVHMSEWNANRISSLSCFHNRYTDGK